jgi:DNA gyrase inhibitor GyrI
MLYVLLLPLGVVAAVVIYLALQPGRISARRSIVIANDRAAVFDTVRDLRSWREWSPWLLHEPDAKLTYSDAPDQKGGWYSWDGNLIGAGRLTHLRLDAPERIEQRIVFTRPFKSGSAVSWEFAEHPSGTEVFWSLRGRMPFMLRFLGPMMSDAIGKDYELGLALLRGHMDSGAEQLRIRFVGEAEYPEQAVLTIPFKGGVDEMVKAMETGFPRLAAAAADQGIEPLGSPFTAYHMADTKSGRFECDLALPVPDGTDAGDLALRRLGGGRYYLTEVQGSYDFLEAVWYSVMAHLRMVKLNWDRKRASLEVYAVDPSTVASHNDLVTRIYVPIR